MWSRLARLATVILAYSLAGARAAESKGISVSLRVKWPGTSILLEAAEFLVCAAACHIRCVTCCSRA